MKLAVIMGGRDGVCAKIQKLELIPTNRGPIIYSVDEKRK